MVDRVVSTKISEETHSKLLDVCNSKGCSSSSFINDAIMEKLKPQEQTKPMTTQEKTNADLARLLGIKPKH